MRKPIYFDYAATTPVDPEVAKTMWAYLTMEGCFGNPASNSHCYGKNAAAAVDAARKQVAALVNAKPKEIVWTSGATESNNLAIKGVAHFYKSKGKHIITSKTEHKAVLDTCKFLESEGFEVTYLYPEKNGLIDINKFRNAIREDTILASIMHVNNEIGVIQDLQSIGECCRQHDIFFHVDAAQSAGKLAIDLQNLPVDLMSFSAHKVYGPKGIGALYVRSAPKVRLQPLIHGGGHEEGMRSGTLATHQIVGMGAAFALAQKNLVIEDQRIMQLRHRLWNGIKELPNITLNGDLEKRVAGNLNISIGGVEGSALLWAIADLAVSTGSACTSATIEPSYVLSALGVDASLAHSSLRISLGRFTTSEEVDYAIDYLRKGILWLRDMSPLNGLAGCGSPS